jgi:hypothetical protein
VDLRNYRTVSAPLMTPKRLKNANGRYVHDFVFDDENEIHLVQPMTASQRWNRIEKAKTPIPQLAEINGYTRSMGGVDQHDLM